MLRLIALALLSFSALIVYEVGGAQEAKSEAAKDLKKLQGEWIFKGVERTTTYTVKGNEYTFDFMGKPSKVTFKIDAAKEPKHIDLTGPRGTVRMGIYKLEGDTLIICTGNSARPTDFKAIQGESGMMVWKRTTK